MRTRRCRSAWRPRRRRQKRLAALMAENPGWSFATPLAAKLRASVSERRHSQYLEEHVTTVGDLEVLHSDGPRRVNRYHYFLNGTENGSRSTSLQTRRVLQTGDRAAGVWRSRSAGDGPWVGTLTNVTGAGSRVAQHASGRKTPRSSSSRSLTLRHPRGYRPWMHGGPSWSEDPASVSSFFKRRRTARPWLTGDACSARTSSPSAVPAARTDRCPPTVEQAAKAQVGAAKMATYSRFVYIFSAATAIGRGWPRSAEIHRRPGWAVASLPVLRIMKWGTILDSGIRTR